MPYEKNDEGSEIYEWNGYKEIYKIDNAGKEILAKNELGNYYYAFKLDSTTGKRVEYLPINRITGESIKIIDSLKNDTCVYPRYIDDPGEPFYEENKYWISKVLGEYYGTNKENILQIYAKDLSRNRQILAKNKNGQEYYAKNLITGEEYYPKTFWKEYYKKIDGMEYPINSRYYARDYSSKSLDSMEEIYPKRFINNDVFSVG